MQIRLSKPGYRSKLVLLFYCAMILVWMSLEDRGALSVSLLGTGFTIILTIQWIRQHYGAQSFVLRSWVLGAVVCGAWIGAFSAIMTALLMFFKTSWHGHIFADYPPLMIWSLLQRMPFWSLAGALIGLAVAMMKLSVIREKRLTIVDSW